MNKLTTIVMGLLTCNPLISYAQFVTTMEYNSIPDKHEYYDSLPQSVFTIETPSPSAASYISLVHSDLLKRAINLPSAIYRYRTDGNKMQYIKDNFYSVDVNYYYKEKHAPNLSNCVNSIEWESETFDYARFIAQRVELEEMNDKDLGEFTENIVKAAESMKKYIASTAGVCPPADPDRVIIFPSDYKTVENVFFSIFLPIHMDPSKQWVDLNRKINRDLLMGQDGLWHLDAIGEADGMYRLVLEAATVPKDYFESLKAKQYEDFFEFMADFRKWMVSNNKSKYLSREIGLACLEDVESAYKPFSLGKCQQDGKIDVFQATEKGDLVLVEVSSE